MSELSMYDRYARYTRHVRYMDPINATEWNKGWHDWWVSSCHYSHMVEWEKTLPATPSPDQGPVIAPLRNYTSAERKEMPLQKVLAEYFPDAFMALARLSRKANEKHNPGEPMHWARGKSSDHLDCAARHLLTPDAVDPETGEQERVAALWRLAADVQLAEEKRLKAAGIMPLSGVVPEK